MTLTATSTLRHVALAVGSRLRRRGIRAILTGGACVSVYTHGRYLSKDADYVIQGPVSQKALDAAMAELGFTRRGDRYVHPATRFYVEFAPGPLSVGGDVGVRPVELPFRGGAALALSATDCCRDRLAAFYHWRDHQSLRLAVAVARHQAVDLNAIRRWSIEEGNAADYEEFLREVALASGGRAGARAHGRKAPHRIARTRP